MILGNFGSVCILVIVNACYILVLLHDLFSEAGQLDVAGVTLGDGLDR